MIDIIMCHWCCLVCSYWWLLIGDLIVVVDLTMLMTNGLTRMEWHQSLVDSVFRVGVWKALLHCIPMLMANGLSRGECHHSMCMTMEPCQPNNSSTCQRAVVAAAFRRKTLAYRAGRGVRRNARGKFLVFGGDNGCFSGRRRTCCCWYWWVLLMVGVVLLMVSSKLLSSPRIPY